VINDVQSAVTEACEPKTLSATSGLIVWIETGGATGVDCREVYESAGAAHRAIATPNPDNFFKTLTRMFKLLCK
jgi:hypothetical protein